MIFFLQKINTNLLIKYEINGYADTVFILHIYPMMEGPKLCNFFDKKKKTVILKLEDQLCE
jgi:hypothetical protein